MLLYHSCAESGYAALQKRRYLTGDKGSRDQSVAFFSRRSIYPAEVMLPSGM